ncbi:hypothetical protein [Chryseobacterium jejuense]|uniref:Uncharacterized protein n=1 Tax=Chryseobacterium jejuense TaxID=445960 RepID=A0A2X2VAS1_CHRJE|nr:hypothetical protein [Chryseobacterium jejuense]SDJ12114.1 hypothetical protein SAMN05421542_2718 [Chryseobacterium jejuense]SQB27952.1 Uncharacterised protein [Chryseobacterium jejuense]
MKHRVLPVAFGLNSFYLSFLYFRMFWISEGRETVELLTYKYMLYSVFFVYPLFIFSTLILTKEFKAGFFLKIFVWLLAAAGPILYFLTFDLFKEKELFYGCLITLVQCLVQSKTVKDDEMIARVAGVFSAKLILWFFILIFSLFFQTIYSDILVNMLFGGIYYLCIGILDILVVRYKFLTEK